MGEEEGVTLESDERLAAEGPRRLLDVYLELKVNHRDVGFRGPERRAWEVADRSVRAELEQIVAAVDDTSAQHDPDELADMVSAMKRRAPGLDSAAVLGTLLEVLRRRLERADRSQDVRTRFVFAGASATGVDWEHAANVLVAWHASLGYSDGDGDEVYLPSSAEALVELWSRAADAKRKKKAARDVVATGPARPYDPRATYRIGDAIAHARFGDGVVVSVTDAIAVLRFASGERKLSHTPPSRVAASGAKTPALPAPAAGPPVVVKRLPPDPRLLVPDAPEQFAELAKNDEGD